MDKDTTLGGTYFKGPVQSSKGYVFTSALATPTSGEPQLYRDASNDLYWWDGSSNEQVNGGGGQAGSLDAAYSGGQSITLDTGAITLTDNTAGALNSMAFVQNGAKSGNILDFSVDAAMTGNAIALDMNLGIGATGIFIDNGATARTGSDILVTDDSTDAHSVIDINSSGSGASVGFDWTGSYNGSPGGAAISLTFDNTDNLSTDGILVTRGTGARNAPVLNIDDASTGTVPVIDIDFSGIFAGNAVDITYASAAATGNAVDLNMGTNLAGNAINLNLAGARSAPAIVIDGGNTDAGTDDHVIDINQTGVLDSNILDITYSSGTSTGNAVNLAMGTNVAGMAVNISSAATGTSGEGSAFNVDHTGNLASGADLVRLSSTGSPSATSNLLSIEQSTGAGTAGAYAVYISATGTNVEALKVDDGNVVFDENLTVSGATALGTLLYKDLTEVVTATNVITAAETGSVFFLNSATEFVSTLPAPAAGLHFTFFVTAAPSGASYTVTTNSSDNIIVGSVHSSTGGNADSETSGADTVTFADGVAVVGDMAEFWCDGTNWFVKAFCDADAGITIDTAS